MNVASCAIESTGEAARRWSRPAHGKGAVTIQDGHERKRIGQRQAGDRDLHAVRLRLAGGVRLAAGDTDQSGFFAEVVTAPATLAQKRSAKIYDDSVDPGSLLHDNPITQAFKPMPTRSSWPGRPSRSASCGRGLRLPGIPADDPGQRDDELGDLGAGVGREDPGSRRLINLFHSFDGDLDVTLTHVSRAQRSGCSSDRTSEARTRASTSPERRGGHGHEPRNQPEGRRNGRRDVQPGRRRAPVGSSTTSDASGTLAADDRRSEQQQRRRDALLLGSRSSRTRKRPAAREQQRGPAGEPGPLHCLPFCGAKGSYCSLVASVHLRPCST